MVVECMIRILEDDPVTNAGTGSNLNLDGLVECDASLMDGTTLGFGSVGAVSDFKNPISVAATILQESDQGALSLGRIPPIMLVGPGVSQWVDTMGSPSLSGLLERVPRQPSVDALAAARDCVLAKVGGSKEEEDGNGSIGGSLVTMEALQQHVRFQSMLKKAAAASSTSITTVANIQAGGIQNHQEMDTIMDGNNDDGSGSPNLRKRSREGTVDSTTQHSGSTAKRTVVDSPEIDDDRLQDTVGAICIDGQGRVAAGVSSGGIAMKFPGRVSEAALFGAGCWAQDATEETDGFACSLTGAGEQITKTLLARTCVETFLSEDDISEAAHQILDRFIKSPLLRSYQDKHVGWIAVKVDRESSSSSGSRDRAELVFAHTTPTMGIGYMSARDSKPTTIMSKRNPESNKVVSSRMIKL
ncbi:taspase, threonine aspartase, 1 [Mortierella sp. AD031]|nr:taspase, threonine aspartase, 1 [Mortierella sp. AD031]